MSDRGTRPKRAPHLQPRLLAFVMLGGAAGTTTRWQLNEAFVSQPGHWPWGTIAINVTGSLLLGLLLETMLRSGADSGWRRGVRVGVGTGFLGGFTTYSTFIVEIDQLVSTGHLRVGLVYAGVSIVTGGLAALSGVALARALRPTRPAARSAR